MKRLPLLFFAAATFAAQADYRIEINKIDAKGVGASLGQVSAAAAPSGGVVFTPDLKGLPPGEHGFHVHEVGNCAPREKDGKPAAGEMAGPHWDPEKHAKHGAATGGGHKGDLPKLAVASNGGAIKPITAPRMKLEDLAGKALMIHAGGDNYSDQPKPNGGGGDRIACGVIQAQR